MMRGTLVVVALAGIMGLSNVEASPRLYDSLPVPDRVEFHTASHGFIHHHDYVLEREHSWHDDQGHRHLDRIWCDRNGQRHVEHVY
jgi:hypothetical protein